MVREGESTATIWYIRRQTEELKGSSSWTSRNPSEELGIESSRPQQKEMQPESHPMYRDVATVH